MKTGVSESEKTKTGVSESEKMKTGVRVIHRMHIFCCGVVRVRSSLQCLIYITSSQMANAEYGCLCLCTVCLRVAVQRSARLHALILTTQKVLHLSNRGCGK